VLQVNDTIKALQDLARAYRDELKAGGCKVIGIAGSNGKTTTRHLIHHVLTHAGLKGTQSPKSFNNHLGVPLTLLSAKPSDDFVAAEIGTNHPGEIDFLSAIARPDIAVITSIGEEHLEFFKDLEGVAKEEFSIVNHLSVDAWVICGFLDDFEADLKSKLYDLSRFREACEEEDFNPPLAMPLYGGHNRHNAAVASAVADIFGISKPIREDALMSICPAPHRGELIRFGEGVTVIDDCYNANPTSVSSALDVLDKLARVGQEVFVFGDMLELGESSPEAHRRIGRVVGKMNYRMLITIGHLAELTHTSANRFDVDRHYAQWSDDLPDQVTALLQPGDTVLLKASRGMRLERLIPAIERRFGPAKGDEPT
jgi:UDP-N-acetylmuramoyl-tripeptide--D-alanyl-D-alanine ligase